MYQTYLNAKKAWKDARDAPWSDTYNETYNRTLLAAKKAWGSYRKEEVQEPCECGELCCNMGETCSPCLEAYN